MDELIKEVKDLKLELNELKAELNKLPSSTNNCKDDVNHKKRKLFKLKDTSARNNSSQSSINLPNRYKRWSQEEENSLVEELKNKLHIIEISKNHGRSNYAIECRIKKIVLEKINTQSLESISEELNLDMVFIKKLIL